MRSGVALWLAAWLYHGAFDAIAREKQCRRGAHRPSADDKDITGVGHLLCT